MPYTQKCVKTLTIRISTTPIDTLKHNGLFLGLFSDERPPRGFGGLIDWRLNGLVSSLIAQGKIGGNFMGKTLIYPERQLPFSKILLLDIGTTSGLTYEILYSAGFTFLQTACRLHCNDFMLEVPGAGRCSLNPSEMTRRLLSGLLGFCEETKGTATSLSLTLLGTLSVFDEIMLGIHSFKVEAKKRIHIDIVESAAGI